MKSLVFDTGPLITLALNGLLNMVPFLKDEFKGNFYICNQVKKELVDVPLKTKKYAFEAMQMRKLIGDGHLDSYDTEDYSQDNEMTFSLVNSIYSINGQPLQILNKGEIDALVLAKNIEADAVVIDERTTRLLIENPFRLEKMLEKKFNADVVIDRERLKEFESHFSTLKIIRSVELVLVGIDLGFFNEYFNNGSRNELVNALLWAMKLNGCAISEKEIKILTKAYR